MKSKILLLMLSAGIVLFWAIAPVYSLTGNLLAPNKHNLSAASGYVGSPDLRAQSETQICIFCHTPHTSLTDGPLWNHKLSSATYTVSRRGVDSATQLSAPLNPPDGSSKLCLSCHDGTVPLGSVQDNIIQMKTVGFGPLTGSTVIGTDLRVHHLVSIQYNGSGAGTLVADKQAQCGTVSWKLAAPPGYPYLQKTHSIYVPGCADPLGCKDPANWYDGVQCTSCHDPHNDPTPGTTKFLRDTSVQGGPWPWNNYDALCQHCHISCP